MAHSIHVGYDGTQVADEIQAAAAEAVASRGRGGGGGFGKKVPGKKGGKKGQEEAAGSDSDGNGLMGAMPSEIALDVELPSDPKYVCLLVTVCVFYLLSSPNSCSCQSIQLSTAHPHQHEQHSIYLPAKALVAEEWGGVGAGCLGLPFLRSFASVCINVRTLLATAESPKGPSVASVRACCLRA